MSERVRKYRCELHLLSSCSDKTKNLLIQHLQKDFIAAICDVLWTTLSGVVPLTKKQKAKIKPHQDILRKVCDAGKTIAQKRKLLRKPIAGKALREVLNTVKSRF